MDVSLPGGSGPAGLNLALVLDLDKNIDVGLGQGPKWRRNIAENFNRLSRAHERCRRQTTDER